MRMIQNSAIWYKINVFFINGFRFISWIRVLKPTGIFAWRLLRADIERGERPEDPAAGKHSTAQLQPGAESASVHNEQARNDFRRNYHEK